MNNQQPFIAVLTLSTTLSLAAMFIPASVRAQSPVAFAYLGIAEIELTADRDYDNPFWDVTVTVEATAPSGRTQRVEAFWDGGRTWRARWRGDESGPWTWQAAAADGADTGLNAGGTLQHGDARPPRMLRASDDGTHVVDDAGEPFFWLADTAWNGALRSKPDDWNEYLDARAQQGFTAIQFVTTQWRGGDRVLERHAFAGTERITIDPQAFIDLDAKIAAIVARRLCPAPVMLWALTETDPGQALAEADAIRLARYELARWGALAPVWLLGGDGRFLEDVPRWQRLGRETFADQSDQLVTLHPSGLSWVGDAFAGEEWFDFLGYQSGHGDGDDDLKWLAFGPPAAQWQKLGKPVINLEPNYEGHPAYQSGELHDAHAVRRAAYWSLLVSPPAGVTYGNNEIWCWNEQTADAENHGNLRQIRPWPELRPVPQLLAEQPGEEDPHNFIAIAQTPDGAWTVVYLPAGGSVSLNIDLAGKTVEWINPRTGQSQPAAQAPGSGPDTLAAPDNNDWILSIH
jgi:hypothetical protein